MDYEKKYKEALELMKDCVPDENGLVHVRPCDIFTELKESEDERIRKRIIDILENDKKHYLEEIAWLEKQGEQKPADKVEPKFKVGDWVVNKLGDLWHIDSFDKKNYQVSNGDKYNYFPISKQNEMHLWTIEYAKDGDVLACENGWTCIFKTLVNDETFSSYCFMDNTKWFCETGSEAHTLKEEFVKAYNGKIHPATKEQCNLLFQKMKEAGYEWDDKKLELKKVEQKPVWSEEDEKMFEHIIAKATLHFSSINYLDEEEINFLKSLKDRYTWKPSDEQIKALNYVVNIMASSERPTENDLYCNILKSLRQQLKKHYL